ncbi:unnamed protein product [Protopolystoma xenopodis]|uniref:Uncharacterized protein n=1 Tax=Protopolystoma xenopodis TaxID=117903 RepID=A0A3S5B510_9PLAT|nr:unnamed protein product [Protopolystoma xenopodis]
MTKPSTADSVGDSPGDRCCLEERISIISRRDRSRCPFARHANPFNVESCGEAVGVIPKMSTFEAGGTG